MEENTPPPLRLSRNNKKCVICNKRRTPGSGVFLSRIPLDPVRCRMWIKAIGQEELVHVPLEKLHQLKYVCDLHFRPQDSNLSKTRLMKNAIPSLNLPLNPLEDDLLQNVPLHIGQYPPQEFIHREPDLHVTPKRITQLLNHDHQYWTGGSKNPKNVHAECTTEKESPDVYITDKTMSSENKKNVGNKRHRCLICGVFYCADYQKDSFLARFPSNVIRCRKWLKVVGERKLLSLSRIELMRRYVCEKHFTNEDFNSTGTRLRKFAVPSQNFSRPPLEDDLLLTYPPVQTTDPSASEINPDAERIKHLSDHDHIYDIKNKPYRKKNSPSDWLYDDDTYDTFNGTKRGLISATLNTIAEKIKQIDHDHIYGIKNYKPNKKYYPTGLPEHGTCGTFSGTRGTYENKINIPNQNEFLDNDDYVDQTRHSNEESDVEGDCTEIEYLEQDESADSDDSADMKRRQDSCTPSKMIERDFKLKLDDIDLLFLSYAKTFRSLARQFQTMLKLDIAKLFSRYEMKNASLGPEANKPSESPFPSDDGESTKSDDLPLKPRNLDLDTPPLEKIIEPRKRLEPEKIVQEKPVDFVFPKEEPKRVYSRHNLQALSKTTPPVSTTQVTMAKKPYTIYQIPQATGSQVVRAAMPSTLGGKLIFISPDGKILRPVPKTKVKKSKTENVSSSLKTAEEFSPADKILRPLPKSNLSKPVTENVSSSLDPVVSLQRLNIVKAQERTVSTPKMGIAESDDDEIKMEDDAGDPELEMEVHTETVFVAEDDGQFSGVET